jgi:hypothetical protein
MTAGDSAPADNSEGKAPKAAKAAKQSAPADNSEGPKQSQSAETSAQLQARIKQLFADNKLIEKRALQAEADLKTANDKIAALQEKLRGIGDGDLPVEHLGKGDHALRRGCTFTGLNGSSDVRIDGRRGDIVTLDHEHIDGLQAFVGAKGKVYHVGKDALSELQKLNFVT